MSLNLKRYFLGSPMALSTMMEIRCAPVCYSTERVYNLSDLQPGMCFFIGLTRFQLERFNIIIIILYMYYSVDVHH